MSAGRERDGGGTPNTYPKWLGTDSAAITTKVTTALVWLVIVAGPVLGGLALVKAGTATPMRVVAERSDRPASEGPQEFAVRSLSRWISGEDATRDGWPDPQGTREARSLHVAGVSKTPTGLWSVTVSGRVAEENNGDSHESDVRYWRVGVEAGKAGQGYALTGTPVEVAGPRELSTPELAYGTAVEEPEGELGLLLSGFFQAYLAGQPGLDRYSSPGSRLRAPKTGFSDVRIIEVAASGNVDLSTTVKPRPGRELDLLAAVQPTSDAGPAPVMQYALTVRARAGRWEVAALQPTPRVVGLDSMRGSDR